MKALLFVFTRNVQVEMSEFILPRPSRSIIYRRIKFNVVWL